MENNALLNSLKTTLSWRDNAKYVMETLAPAKTATLKTQAGETLMSRQLKRAIARAMGRTLATKARLAKRSSAKLQRSVLRRRKSEARKLNSTAKKRFLGRAVECEPRKKSGYIQVGGLFHV